MNIIFSSDDNYAPLLGIAIFSLLSNNKENSKDINIYIMDMNISNKNKELIDNIINNFDSNVYYLDTTEIHKYLSSLIKQSVRSLATYYRLFLPSLLPNTIDKVIYMDCDILINNSLVELWDTEMNNFDIAGVLDIISIDNKTCIGLKPKDPYVNAGMLVINLKQWRENNLEDKMITFINQHKGMVCYHDQGIINGVCLSKKILHPKYNAMTPFFVMKRKYLLQYHNLTDYYTNQELTEAQENPVYIHFTPYLTDRPWVKNNLHPLREMYYDVQKQTPWGNYKLTKPSKTIEPWVKWLFHLLPYTLFSLVLKSLQKFKPKTWIRSVISK